MYIGEKVTNAGCRTNEARVALCENFLLRRVALAV